MTSEIIVLTQAGTEVESSLLAPGTYTATLQSIEPSATTFSSKPHLRACFQVKGKQNKLWSILTGHHITLTMLEAASPYLYGTEWQLEVTQQHYEGQVYNRATVCGLTPGTPTLDTMLQNDLQELLLILGLPIHARPESPHQVFQQALTKLRTLLPFTHCTTCPTHYACTSRNTCLKDALA